MSHALRALVLLHRQPNNLGRCYVLVPSRRKWPSALANSLEPLRLSLLPCHDASVHWTAECWLI